MTKVRKNINMSRELASWYEEKAEKLGISHSNLMVMALAEYVKQDKTIDVMANMQELMNRLETLKDQDTQK
jgi:hypothetical protein